jgi:two-component system, NarL family, nitrate/nitrite response regulator NarL
MEREAISIAKIRVLLLDNSLIHTQLLADALRRDEGLQVLSASSVKDVMRTAIDGAVDVLVISSTLKQQQYRGLEVLRGVRASRPEIRGVVLLDSWTPEVVREAFRAGARGLFGEIESIEKLCKCIHTVYNGQIWASSEEIALALEAYASAPTVQAVNANGLNLLSKREMDIVQALAAGLKNREIAEKLGLSQHTVKNYLFRIFDKLGVSTRVELLFMTLSQETNSQPAFSGFVKACTERFQNDDAWLQECRQAAEQGLPLAQLLLAQLYASRKRSATDVLLAYHWLTIVGAQISQQSKKLKLTMNIEQRLQAEKMVADWLTGHEIKHTVLHSDTRSASEQKPGVAMSAASD